MNTFTTVRREMAFAALTLLLVHTDFHNFPNVKRTLGYPVQKANVRCNKDYCAHSYTVYKCLYVALQQVLSKEVMGVRVFGNVAFISTAFIMSNLKSEEMKIFLLCALLLLSLYLTTFKFICCYLLINVHTTCCTLLTPFFPVGS